MTESQQSDAALHEFVQVEISVADLGAPGREKALRELLATLDGIESVRVDKDTIFLSYEPVRITKAAIEARLREAGFQVTEMGAASASPVLDATAPHPPGVLGGQEPETGSQS